ncbi:hypothetical protein O988_07408 [Pseudogymnoascus sp. VKM F-3808]|nr:hypothetical protein O988_07408 [Pseudogymnoascus sp. VKM F-3808]
MGILYARPEPPTGGGEGSYRPGIRPKGFNLRAFSFYQGRVEEPPPTKNLPRPETVTPRQKLHRKSDYYFAITPSRRIKNLHLQQKSNSQLYSHLCVTDSPQTTLSDFAITLRSQDRHLPISPLSTPPKSLLPHQTSNKRKREHPPGAPEDLCFSETFSHRPIDNHTGLI